VQIGFLAPSVFDDEFATVKVLDAIIGSGLSSRLFLALGKEGAGIADVAGSFYPTRRDLGRYIVYVSTNEFDRSIGTVEETITNLKTETVTPEELSRAKHRVLGDLTLGRQTNHEQARMLGWAELLGLGTDFVDAHREAVERVGPEDVREAAKQFLVDPVTVVLRPGRGSKRGI
jgi:predicted Zn-dependent peptidase